MANKRFSTKKITVLAVLAALATLTFMIEELFPPLFLPGAKMGLSNVFSMLALFWLGTAEGIAVSVVRITVGSLVAGNLYSFVYSLSAGLASVLVAACLRQLAYPRVSIVAVSVASAVVHNVMQCVVYCAISNTPQMLAYLPYLALLGIVAGVVVGLSVLGAFKLLPISLLTLLRDEVA